MEKRCKPGEDVPRQYSTVSGHLTLTPPKHVNMRMDSTLDVTPEGSLSMIYQLLWEVLKNLEGNQKHNKM